MLAGAGRHPHAPQPCLQAVLSKAQLLAGRGAPPCRSRAVLLPTRSSAELMAGWAPWRGHYRVPTQSTHVPQEWEVWSVEPHYLAERLAGARLP